MPGPMVWTRLFRRREDLGPRGVVDYGPRKSEKDRQCGSGPLNSWSASKEPGTVGAVTNVNRPVSGPVPEEPEDGRPEIDLASVTHSSELGQDNAIDVLDRADLGDEIQMPFPISATDKGPCDLPHETVA